MFRQTPIGIVLALLVALPATAQDYEKGLAAYKREDYAGALREWGPLAENGHAQAQNMFGQIYETGKGVPRNERKAFRFYLQAAYQGVGEAQVSAGIYYTHQNTLQADVLAYMLFNMAITNGEKYAAGLRDAIAERMTATAGL
jgi:TPR repeat protein